MRISKMIKSKKPIKLFYVVVLFLYTQTWTIPSNGTVVLLQELLFTHWVSCVDKTVLHGRMQVKNSSKNEAKLNDILWLDNFKKMKFLGMYVRYVWFRLLAVTVLQWFLEELKLLTQLHSFKLPGCLGLSSGCIEHLWSNCFSVNFNPFPISLWGGVWVCFSWGFFVVFLLFFCIVAVAVCCLIAESFQIFLLQRLANGSN